MSKFAEIVFWSAVALIFHSYILFPFIIRILASFKAKNQAETSANTDLPFVSILLSAYNEEAVIEEKMSSILLGNYPKNKYEILVGSDCSSDQTNTIMEQLAREHPGLLQFFPFSRRQGKPGIINQLVQKAKGEILVLTDANVMFDTDTLTELVAPFSYPLTGLVDSQMVNKGARSSGISIQEKAYISREVGIKHHESVLWGAMMGPFGGCFAIRKKLYEPVPHNFLVDDFFLNMVVIEKGFQAVNNPKAVVYEDVSNDMAIEYRRKIRIATGNFQNLARFKNLLWPIWSGVSFAFISHKVIRWVGPFLFLISFLTAAYLSLSVSVYLTILAAYVIVMLLPFLDHFLKKLRIHMSFLRFITHFCAMNLALFVGFIRYLKGVKTNVWQPTKRNQ